MYACVAGGIIRGKAKPLGGGANNRLPVRKLQISVATTYNITG